MPDALEVRVEDVRWALPVRRSNAHDTFTERAGLLLTLRSAGAIGRGVAAPLVGYGRDSLEAARGALHAMAVPSEVAEHGDLTTIEALAPSSPSAQFALLGAALAWRADRRGTSLVGELGALVEREPTSVSSAAWVEDRAELDREHARGFRTFKIKRRPSADWRTLVEHARGRGLGVRVDANGAPVPDEELAWLADQRVEFVEDPAPDVLERAWHDTPVPIAADLPLANVRDRQVLAALGRGVGVLVLKPTLLGVGRCLALADEARRRGAHCVVSHLLDGPIAWRLHAALACTLGGELAHGLGGQPILDPVDSGDPVDPVDPGSTE